MHILVTGVNGFVGRHLIEKLLPGPHTISVVSRSGKLTTRHDGAPGAMDGAIDGALDGAIASPPRIDNIWTSLNLGVAQLEAVDVVIHLAGLAHAGAEGADAQQLHATNVEATVNLYKNACAAKVKGFIWLSSIKVLGDGAIKPYQIDDPYQPGDAYAQSKCLAERELLNLVDAPTHLHIVRPPLVYGPGVKANFAQLVKLGTSKWPLPLAGAQAPRAWLAVANLVDLLLQLTNEVQRSAMNTNRDEPIAAPGAFGSADIWHVRDAEESSVAQMIRKIGQAYSVRNRLFYVNSRWAKAVATCIGQKARADRLFDSLQVDMNMTQTKLNWSPPYNQIEQLRAMQSGEGL